MVCYRAQPQGTSTFNLTLIRSIDLSHETARYILYIDSSLNLQVCLICNLIFTHTTFVTLNAINISFSIQNQE